MEFEPTEEAIKAEEQQSDRFPFIIRAHHLANFIELLKSGKSVNDFEGTSSKLFEKNRVYYSKRYLNDVLGSTQEQADKYKRYETEFYEEFLQLPPDYPVKIVEDQKDKLCQGCAIGEHCSKIAIREDSNRDRISIENFINVAKKLNVKDDLTVVDEIATYSNAEPRKVKSILTTARTVKKIILSVSDSYLFTNVSQFSTRNPFFPFQK